MNPKHKIIKYLQGSATEADRKDRDSRAKEEQYWREAEGEKSRAAKKREEEAEKRAEAAAKKAEVRRLAEQEEKDLEKSLRKPDKKADRVSVPVPKVTEAELRCRKEEEQAELQRRAEEEKKKQSRIADEEEYERMVSVVNTNRDDSKLEARSVEEAIAQMSVVDPLPVDKHPEKRLKASFKAFEEAELPKLKDEKPGLTHNQYKYMIWKLWKKSPDNPLNKWYMHVWRARFGGFAAALADFEVDCWVMNVVPVSSPNTLPVIFDRGLVGVMHDWCEPFDTYPITYYWLNAAGLFSVEQRRCNITNIMLEMDRILRPGGRVYIRDFSPVIDQLQEIAKAIGWVTFMFDSGEGPHSNLKLLTAEKRM